MTRYNLPETERFFNYSGETAPAFGVCAVSTTIQVKEKPCISVTKPIGSDAVFVINGPKDVSSQNLGRFYRGPVVVAKYELGEGDEDYVPQIGDTLGPLGSSWFVKRGGGPLITVLELLSEENKLVLGFLNGNDGIKFAILDEDLYSDSEAVATTWRGNPLAGTEEKVTVKSWGCVPDGEYLDAGTKVAIRFESGQWYVFVSYTEATFLDEYGDPKRAVVFWAEEPASSSEISSETPSETPSELPSETPSGSASAASGSASAPSGSPASEPSPASPPSPISQPTPSGSPGSPGSLPSGSPGSPGSPPSGSPSGSPGSPGSGSPGSGSVSGASGSPGSASGASGSPGEPSGSDKSTAIVPAAWSPTGFTALFVAESPEVIFFDLPQFEVTKKESWHTIDSRFIQVCEPDSLKVICGCEEAIPIGGKVVDGQLRIRLGMQPEEPVAVTAAVFATRKGFRDMRFPKRSRKQFESNERFIRSAYDHE